MPLLICPECDTLQRLPALQPGSEAHCHLCGARIHRRRRGGLSVPLALLLGTAVFFLLANLFPLLTLHIQGNSQTSSITGAALALYREDMVAIAVLTWLTSVLFPGLVIASGLYVLTALRFGLRLPGLRQVLKLISLVHPWGMLDVFMLGVMVALVKLSGTADITLGVGIQAFAALVILFAWAMSQLEVRQLWQRLEEIGR